LRSARRVGHVQGAEALRPQESEQANSSKPTADNKKRQKNNNTPITKTKNP